MNPFRVAVHGKNHGRLGWIGDPLAVTATVRHNLLSTADVTFRGDHPKAADVLTEGARLMLTYNGSHLLGGQVTRIQADGDTDAYTATVADDWALLDQILCWPKPGAALNAQDVAYDTRTGSAEAVVKALIAANATRLGLSVTTATNLNRGNTVWTSHRFHPLRDRIDLDTAGIGVTVTQVDTGYVVDCYEPTVYPRTLTEASGVVQSWSWTRTAPTATRVIAGNQGEAEARTFQSSVDSTREALWGRKVEVFVDARDTADTTETAQRMSEALTENAAKAGLSVELSETDTFRYGNNLRVGDQITLQVGHGIEVTDVLREAVLTWTVGDGFRVTPVVGELDLDNTVVARAVGRLARGIRNLNRS